MSQPPAEEDLAKLASALAMYPRPTITGAVLGTLLRRAAPDLDVRAAVAMPIGTGALARFADKFLPHLLRRAGQTASDGTGGDVVYEILRPANDQAPNSADNHPVETNHFWAAFVRPSDQSPLAVVRVGDVPQLYLGDGAPANGIPIAKVSPEEFQSIANSFVEQIATVEGATALADQLRQTTTYVGFLEKLKEQGTAYVFQWSRHRRGQLRQLFLNRLESAGLSLAERQHLLLELDRSQLSARQETTQRNLERAADANANVRPGRDSLPHSGEDLARMLLKAMVDGMSIHEMRSLPISFGQALDAVQILRLHK